MGTGRKKTLKVDRPQRELPPQLHLVEPAPLLDLPLERGLRLTLLSCLFLRFQTPSERRGKTWAITTIVTPMVPNEPYSQHKLVRAGLNAPVSYAIPTAPT